jgi:hypothetical protein
MTKKNFVASPATTATTENMNKCAYIWGVHFFPIKPKYIMYDLEQPQQQQHQLLKI